jgi:hypothetical protein
MCRMSEPPISADPVRLNMRFFYLSPFYLRRASALHTSVYWPM